MTSVTRRIGVIGFDGANSLDVVGPIEAFANAGRADCTARGSRGAYETCVIGLSMRPFTTESGVRLTPDTRFADAPHLDTLIVPGGWGIREPATVAPLVAWLSSHAPGIRRVVTVCTGIYALAATGLLDGRCATTHWRFFDDVARCFPRVRIDRDALYVRDGRYYTSGGITAGIDLALALIEEDLGPRAALEVARELVMFLKRPGGQAQFSEPLQHQSHTPDGFADLVAWICGHLRADLSVDMLARRACMSPRNFGRRFTAAVGLPPAKFVEATRLAAASERLLAGTVTVENVARSVGYANVDVFRRRFERRFGVTPTNYRIRFSTADHAHRRLAS